MANKTFNTRIQTKRDTSANWESKNPVLLNGEEIIVDTNSGEVRKKIGDGKKTYTQLPFTDETLKTSISTKVDKVSGKGLSTNDFTTALLNKLNGIDEGANKYTHPSYTARSAGLYKITVDTTGHVSAVTSVSKADITGLGIPSTNTTYSTMSAATSSNNGSSGLVPAPAAGKQTSFLRGDGTWAIPTNTTYSDATTSTHGLMSSGDKSKLDSIADNANNYTHPSSHAATMITQDATHRFVSDDEKSVWSSKAGTAVATTSANGLMSSGDKTKLDEIESGANKYTHPTYTAKASGLYKITVDGSGHISATSAVGKSDITALGIPGTNTTYNAMRAATADAAGSAGLVPAPGAGKQGMYLRGDGTWATPTNTTYSTMGAATSSAAGSTGLVPAPAAGKQGQYLRGDGTWATPTNTTYGVATTSANGLMSSTDKTTLDNLATRVSTLETNYNNLLAKVKTGLFFS